MVQIFYFYLILYKKTIFNIIEAINGRIALDEIDEDELNLLGKNFH